MEVVMLVVMLAVPVFVVVTFVLMLQTRQKVRKVASMASKCFKRQLAEDVQGLSSGGADSDRLQAYVADMLSDD